MATKITSMTRATLMSPVRSTGREPFGLMPVTPATAAIAAAIRSQVSQVMHRQPSKSLPAAGPAEAGHYRINIPCRGLGILAALDRAEQGVGVDRLRNVSVHAGGQTTLTVSLHGVGG